MIVAYLLGYPVTDIQIALLFWGAVFVIFIYFLLDLRRKTHYEKKYVV